MSTVRKPTDATPPAESVLTLSAHPGAAGDRPLSGSEAEPGTDRVPDALAGPTDTDAETAPETSEADEAWTALKALTERERRFVLAAAQGKDWSDCARAGGIQTELGVIRWLGRPRIVEALRRIAPAVMALDAKRGARLMVAQGSEKLLDTLADGSDAQKIAAVKELFSVAGLTVHRSEHVTASLADVLKALSVRRVSVEAPRKRLASAEVIEGSATEVTDSKSVDGSIWGRTLPAGSREAGDDGPGADEPVKRGRGRGRRRK